MIGLLSTAMLGLIVFQFYWIKDVLRVNEERFTQNVQEALNGVANKLARQSDIFFLEKENKPFIPPRKEQKVERVHQDSIYAFNLPKRMGSNQVIDSDVLMNFSSFRFNVDESGNRIHVFFDFQGTQWEDLFLIDKIDPKPANDQRIHFEKQMKKRFETMKRSWTNHLVGSDNLFERIDPAVLDTLLQRELKHMGIELPYDYGITQSSGNEVKFLKTSDAENAERIQQSPMRANLFPMDLVPKDYFLSVFFPTQKNYLLKQALLPLSASGLLMLVVILCFAYAIMTILRQKKLSEMKNDFINNMTHEFKTPIATVSLATEALQDGDLKSNPGIVDRYVQVIRDENKRLGMQVEKVLQIASLDKKDFKLKFEKVDVHDIIDKALANIDLTVQKRGGEITSRLLASNPVIEADPVHLTNIIYNLLDNANKYSPEAPEIHLRTENISTGVIIKIADQGIGMSKEATQKIFDKFFRVSTGNLHDVKGFGLGLSYVKDIVDMHRGTITVKSEVGKGSTFKVYLPFAHV